MRNFIRNEAEVCPWGLLCREELLEWCPQNGSGLFWRLLESQSCVIKDLVIKIIPGISVCTGEGTAFPGSLLGPPGLGHPHGTLVP